ncbi:MAG: hypothetical protein ACJ790_03780 [Myxococcaceae bacterium]
MLIGSALLLLLSAEPVSLAQPQFNAVNVSPEVARFCGEHLATEMNARGIRVVTARDIESMLGMERQKQLLGCNEAANSCMAELANALGTDGIVLGDLAKLGTRYQLNLKVLSSKNTELLAVYRTGIDREEDLVPELTKAAEALVPEVLRKLGRAAPTTTTVITQPGPPREHHWPLAPTIASGALAITGGTLHAFAFDAQDRLINPSRGPIDEPTAKDLKSRGEIFQAGAYVSYGLAVACVGAAAFFYLRGDEPALPTAMITPSGAAIGVAGVLP